MLAALGAKIGVELVLGNGACALEADGLRVSIHDVPVLEALPLVEQHSSPRCFSPSGPRPAILSPAPWLTAEEIDRIGPNATKFSIENREIRFVPPQRRGSRSRGGRRSLP